MIGNCVQNAHGDPTVGGEEVIVNVDAWIVEDAQNMADDTPPPWAQSNVVWAQWCSAYWAPSPRDPHAQWGTDEWERYFNATDPDLEEANMATMS